MSSNATQHWHGKRHGGFAIFGRPIVFGPHMQNFKEIADAFITNGAAIQVRSAQELDEVLLAQSAYDERRAHEESRAYAEPRGTG